MGKNGNHFVALVAGVSPSGIANDPAKGGAGNSRHRVRSLTAWGCWVGATSNRPSMRVDRLK